MRITDKNNKMMRKGERRWRIVKKRYGINLVIIIVVMLVTLMVRNIMPPYTVDYKPDIITSAIENETKMNTIYHYYLDFSPSMEGFFASGIDSNMKKVADALRKVNVSGNEKNFFFCADRIVPVEEKVLYENMENETGIRLYYDDIIYSSGMDLESEPDLEDIRVAINKINLAEIFYLNYGENHTYETGKESLNIIITDLNFKKSNNDEDSESNKKLIDEFARYFSENCAQSNVAVYQIYSNFAGITSDEYELDTEYGIAEELHAFYIFVESQNDIAYMEFTKDLETELTGLGIDTAQKYELLNRVSNGTTELKIDVNALKRNNRIKIENFLYDNKSFDNLQSNAMGLRMVQEKGISYLHTYTSPIEIIGTYYTDGAASSNVVMNVEAKVSYPVGKEKYEIMENEIVSSVHGSTSWEDKELYLIMDMELNPDRAKEELKKVQERRLKKAKYFIIELQCFLEKPEYTLPEWIVDNEMLQDKRVVYEDIIEAKENSFSKLSKEQRYLGSMILYITY